MLRGSCLVALLMGLSDSGNKRNWGAVEWPLYSHKLQQVLQKSSYLSLGAQSDPATVMNQRVHPGLFTEVNNVTHLLRLSRVLYLQNILIFSFL